MLVACIAGWATAAVLLALFAWAYTAAAYRGAQARERWAWEHWRERLLEEVDDRLKAVVEAALKAMVLGYPDTSDPEDE